MTKQRLKLGVNIDHVATLRQARGTSYPDVVTAAAICESAGAQGITIHLREDRRHIQDADVYELRRTVDGTLNLEMANVREIVEIAAEVGPDEVCLVPEKREELTTEGGLDVVGQRDAMASTVGILKDAGIKVSLFVEAAADQLSASRDIGADYVELHTGTFCDATGDEANAELEKLISGARTASDLGLQVNAGHGINTANIDRVLEMPHLDTLNIGHSIVARAVFVGLETAVGEILDRMAAYGGGRL
ncbi:MAG: pyridoxine 5'-phosphate synthase [Kiritimatiellia bacterium]|jgi:pyridoxine 5-phosphate synthase|nr:pyridoxine 5'-phosphate synthase [Kiritimatiellia bacterium]